MSATQSDVKHVAIIGAGLSGLGMAIQLQKAGFHDWLILEKSDGVGGTWRDNSYPGSGCDVPSMFYSFSFEPKTDWTRKFAEQPEILEYIEFCADKYNLRPQMRFNTELATATFDDDQAVWTLTTTTGETLRARFLISGCGQLNRPLYPDIPGRESFTGKSIHTARWDHHYPLEGKRVAVIGNGASAVQMVPPVANRVAQMTLFQRSANWIFPKPDRPFTDRERAIFTKFPLANKLYRAFLWTMFEIRWPVFHKGSKLGKNLQEKTEKDIRSQVHDPNLMDAVIPDYQIGCKRILISNDYYSALQQDNVDVIRDHITEITPDGLTTQDGTHYQVDAILYATGFETSAFLAPINITGTNGKRLDEAWRNGAEAYLGITLDGFPNFFMLYGPNTNLGHNSIILMIELQIRYIINCIKILERDHLKSMQLRPDIMREYSVEVQDSLTHSVWDASCGSWYKNDDGKITNNWPYSTIQYWWRTRYPDFTVFDVKANQGSTHERT